MPFNQAHLLNGIAFAHGMNQEEQKAGAPTGKANEITPEHHEALKQLHKKLLEHHINNMNHHASQVRLLTGSK